MKQILMGLSFVLGFAGPAHAETWLSAANGQIGSRPVWVGREGGADVYVCRASFGRNKIPGKLIRRDGKCYIGYYGKEYAFNQYQVLQDTSGRLRFFSSHSVTDPYLTLGGFEDGKNLHICKVRISAGEVAGKMVGGVEGGICYYGYYGKEYRSTIFDVLTDA